jgi:porin
LAFSATKFIGDKWLPFVRAGYAKGGASLLQASIGGGLGIRFENTDVFGIGFSWGRPFGANPRDQYTAEAFYRWQATDILAITPNFQLILDPSNNASESSIAVFGVRARAAL